MPRHPDPDLEERILKAAHVLWHRGGEKALTLRGVAKAARTNTPAVYRRFKDRHDLLRGLLLRIVARLRGIFEASHDIEDILESYVEFALREPHEYELFYAYSHELNPRKRVGGPAPPIRDSRPNFKLLEERLAERLGGSPEDHTKLALALWAIAHGTTTLLLSKVMPQGHEEELRAASRSAVQALLKYSAEFSEKH
jgi:AcrR family transcriptional regulator